MTWTRLNWVRVGASTKFFEHINEYSGYIKGVKFLDELQKNYFRRFYVPNNAHILKIISHIQGVTGGMCHTSGGCSLC
jgi:hypothetical protein